MNEIEDSAWVFDSLVGFLQGPIWSAPLVTFIEEKSLSKYKLKHQNISIKKLQFKQKLLSCFYYGFFILIFLC